MVVLIFYPKIVNVAVSFRTIFTIGCGWDGKIWSSHAVYQQGTVPVDAFPACFEDAIFFCCVRCFSFSIK